MTQQKETPEGTEQEGKPADPKADAMEEAQKEAAEEREEEGGYQ